MCVSGILDNGTDKHHKLSWLPTRTMRRIRALYLDSVSLLLEGRRSSMSM